MKARDMKIEHVVEILRLCGEYFGPFPGNFVKPEKILREIKEHDFSALAGYRLSSGAKLRFRRNVYGKIIPCCEPNTHFNEEEIEAAGRKFKKAALEYLTSQEQ